MNKTIYALGFFDGVHIGHAALLEACRELAREFTWEKLQQADIYLDTAALL